MNSGQMSSVLFLSPEAPYPLHGGGAYRTASLLHFFARFAQVDLILFSESGEPALLPPGLVRSQKVIPLPRHGRGLVARYMRNARRAIAGIPPLIDRLSGMGPEITRAIGGTRYDLGVIEHFWLAPYITEVKLACRETVLDLHNVESMLHQRCATSSKGLVRAGHRRFASASQTLEAELLPRFSRVLATSEADRRAGLAIAPSATITVYPNALPGIAAPSPVMDMTNGVDVVFSGNFEYHPNIDAVRFLVTEIWPAVLAGCNTAKNRPRLKLVGRGDQFIRKFLPSDKNIEVTGAVPDARPEIAAASLVIAPLRAGSGTRIKILEAWSVARPVLATPLAAEGLETRNGENILLAETPSDFARQLLHLLETPYLRQRLGEYGRKTFERYYTWEAAWHSLERDLQLTRPETLNRYTGNF